MKLVASESYNVAWFKLADFVARGEKERALSVHKLLMHSVSDEAISYQLEGDILLAFNDDAALDRYHVAANLYKKSGKIHQAASIYEHVTLFKEDEKILEALIDVHVVLKNESRILDVFSQIAMICLKKDNVGSIINRFHRYLLEFDQGLQARLAVRFVRTLLIYDKQYKQITTFIYQAIDLLQQGDMQDELLQFLSLLEELHHDEYQKAQQYVEHNF